MNLGLLQLAKALDKAELMRVDQNIGDRWILQQRFDRTIAGHFVDDLLRKYFKLALIERNLLGPDVRRHIGGNLLDQLLPRQLFQQRQIELVDDARMQLELLVEQGGTLRDQVLVGSFHLGVILADSRQPPFAWRALRCSKQETHDLSPTGFSPVRAPRPRRVTSASRALTSIHRKTPRARQCP